MAVLLREAADKLVQQWGQKLAELPVRLIEAPDFRLAGAEEVIRQMVASIEQALQHHEPLARELSTRAASSYDSCGCIACLACAPMPPACFASRPPAAASCRRWAETQELLRDYPKTLYQSLLLRQAGNIFLTLRGHLADEMREINFCRVRLGELLRMLEEPAETLGGRSTNSALVQAPLSRRLQGSPARRSTHFENQSGGGGADTNWTAEMEAMLKKQFTALVNVCLTSGNVLKKVEAAMLQTAEEFVAARLGEMNVAEMFLEEHADERRGRRGNLGVFSRRRAPQLPHSAVGSSHGGSRLASCACWPRRPALPASACRALASQALPDIEWQPAPGDEDIVLYRELRQSAARRTAAVGAARPGRLPPDERRRAFHAPLSL